MTLSNHPDAPADSHQTAPPAAPPSLLRELQDFLDRFIPLALPVFSFCNVVMIVAIVAALLLDALGLTHLDTGPSWHDFQSFWSAGIAAKTGMGGHTYDVLWYENHVKAVIGEQGQAFGWHYPPQFFLLLVPLTVLPMPLAFVVWTVMPLVLLGLLVYRLVPKPTAPLIALGAPILIINAGYAQNGILSTLMIGFALLPFIEGRQPSAFGTSLLAFKPHLGLVFPVAYASGGCWLSFGLTIVWLLLQTGLTALVFGPQIWLDFLGSLAQTQEILFSEIGAGAFHYVSVYGAVRLLHGDHVPAMAAQILVGGLVLYKLWTVWRQPVNRPLKAALLVASVPLTAPYLMHYDMSIGVLAVTLLIRHRAFANWQQSERMVLAGVWLLSTCNMAIQKQYSIPSGLICNLVVYSLAVAMIRRDRPSQTAASSPKSAY